MMKIFLDLVLILLFITIAGLQVYVIYKIRELKKYYKKFSRSEKSFKDSIEKARQSLMILNSQSTDILPELKENIDKSESLMQDFSFVMSRVNRKIDQLEKLSSNAPSIKINTKEKKDEHSFDLDKNMNKPYMLNNMDNLRKQETKKETPEETDPLLARLSRLEKEETSYKPSKKVKTQQEELVEKALREVL